MRWLVLGGSGQIGEQVVLRLVDRREEVVATYRHTSPRIPKVEFLRWNKGDPTSDLPWATLRPDVVVDTAMLRSVDDCESHPKRAYGINAEGTAWTAQQARGVGARYLLVSTDYVFGGPTPAPHDEKEPPDPRCVYARSLWAAEEAVRATDPRNAVVRTSTVYSWRPTPPAPSGAAIGSPNFATWLVQEVRQGHTVRVVTDQITSPTYAPDLAEAILAIVDRRGSGVFHATGLTSLSRYDFALRLLTSVGEPASSVVPVATSELGQKAPRPHNSSLGLRRLMEEIDVHPADLPDQMRRWARAVRGPG